MIPVIWEGMSEVLCPMGDDVLRFSVLHGSGDCCLGLKEMCPVRSRAEFTCGL